MTHRQELLNRLIEYFDSQNWHYKLNDHNDGSQFVTMGMNIDCKLGSCQLIIDPEENGIVVLAVCPLKASPEDYANTVEYITRANYGLKAGSFEFDYSDGEIRYRNFLRCAGQIPTLSDVEFTVDVTFLMMRRYGNGLAKAVMGFGSPEQDVAEAEK